MILSKEKVRTLSKLTGLSPAEIRWKGKRLEQLFAQGKSEKEALEIIDSENPYVDRRKKPK